MATKRKTKTVVTYDVEFLTHDARDPCDWLTWARGYATLKGARAEARRVFCVTRIVRVERTVVAEVRP